MTLKKVKKCVFCKKEFDRDKWVARHWCAQRRKANERAGLDPDFGKPVEGDESSPPRIYVGYVNGRYVTWPAQSQADADVLFETMRAILPPVTARDLANPVE
ncbi:hypothetical protein [Pacificispira sp.]|uniref:hypothetical protein n=1 Tax=Pacificispira sp. TaxID=2888761 RepID=UPI003BAAAEB7